MKTSISREPFVSKILKIVSIIETEANLPNADSKTEMSVIYPLFIFNN